MGKDQRQGRAPGPRARDEKADCVIPDGSALSSMESSFSLSLHMEPVTGMSASFIQEEKRKSGKSGRPQAKKRGLGHYIFGGCSASLHIPLIPKSGVRLCDTHLHNRLSKRLFFHSLLRIAYFVPTRLSVYSKSWKDRRLMIRYIVTDRTAITMLLENVRAMTSELNTLLGFTLGCNLLADAIFRSTTF